MKIEFLNDISKGGQYKDVVSDRLIRLFDFDSNEAEQFQRTIKKLIKDGGQIDVTLLSFVNPINCSLTLRLKDEDLGIIKIKENNFDCVLTKDSYEDMVLLIQPFVDKESDGYQWLYNGQTEIDFLFSPGGTW